VLTKRKETEKYHAGIRPLSRLSRLLKCDSSDNLCNVFRESFYPLLFASITGLLTGLFLSGFSSYLTDYPGILVLIPGAIAMRGNIFASMGSRLGTAIHTGELTIPFTKSRSFVKAVKLSLVQTIILSFYLGILTYLVSLWFLPNRMSMEEYVTISVVAGLISGFFLLIFTVFIVYTGYGKEWDVDNVSVPLITAMGDIITVPSVFLSAWLTVSMGKTGSGIFFYIFVIVIIYLLTGIMRVGTTSKFHDIKRALNHSIPILSMCGIFSIITGTILSKSLDSLIVFSAILFVIPSINEEAGNSGGIVASRLSSALFIGDENLSLKPGKFTKDIMKGLVFSNFIAFNIMFMVSGIITGILNFGTPGIMEMYVIILMGGMISTTSGMIVAYYLNHISFRKGLDPDNIVIPLITSFMDILGTLTIVLIMLVMI